MRAAFYECDITPPLGGYMWGYYCKRNADDVAENLYAKALVVEDGGTIAAIVSVDACALPREMHDIVTKRIYEYTGIPAENVCISATHTHKGVPVSDSPEINCFADKSYTDVFYRLTADAVILAYKRLGDDPVEVSFGKGEVTGVAFNRNGMLKDGTLVTQLRGRDNVVCTVGDVDESLNVITFSKGGKKIGAVVNFSCHLDCTGGVRMAYSGDYAAVLSGILKEKYGSDFVSLFLTGACGNVNHINHDKNQPVNKYTEIGRKVADEALRVIDGSDAVFGTVASSKESITIEKRLPCDAEYQRLVDPETGEFIERMWLQNYMYYETCNDETHTNLKIQVIKIGDICICALPGEIYAKTGLNIKRNSPYKNTIVVENSNTYCGYVPTEDVFVEKCRLYETMLCFHSCLVPGAAEAIEEKALDMIKNM